jgi:hypothetical protein
MCDQPTVPSTGKGKPKYAMIKPTPSAPVVRRMAPGELQTISQTINVPQTARLSVQMDTNAVDRSKGFLIATVPLFAGLALGLVLISTFFFNVPFLSLTALVIFWLSFVGAWLVAYGYTLAVSVEGISLFEAKANSRRLDREQSERWDYYKRLDGEK